MEWVKRTQPLSDKEITDLENRLRVSLPEDFIHVFKQYQAPESNHVMIDIDNEQEDIDDRYDVEEFYPLEDIVEEAESFFDEEEELKSNGIAVPFAFTTTLDQYCFFYPKGSEVPSGIFFRPRDYALLDIFEGNDIKDTIVFKSNFPRFLRSTVH